MKNFELKLKETLNQHFRSIQEIKDTLNFLDEVKVLFLFKADEAFKFHVITDDETYVCYFDKDYNFLEVSKE